MRRLTVKSLSKVQNLLWITALQIWPYLGASKCWGHSILQTPAVVKTVSSAFLICKMVK